MRKTKLFKALAIILVFLLLSSYVLYQNTSRVYASDGLTEWKNGLSKPPHNPILDKVSFDSKGVIFEGSKIYYHESNSMRISTYDLTDMTVTNSPDFLVSGSYSAVITNMVKIGNIIYFEYTYNTSNYGLGTYDVTTQSYNLNYGASVTGASTFQSFFGSSNAVVGTEVYVRNPNTVVNDIYIFDSSTNTFTATDFKNKFISQTTKNPIIWGNLVVIGSKIYCIASQQSVSNSYGIYSYDTSNNTLTKEVAFDNMTSVYAQLVGNGTNLYVLYNSGSTCVIKLFDTNTKALSTDYTISDKIAGGITNYEYVIAKVNNYIFVQQNTSRDIYSYDVSTKTYTKRFNAMQNNSGSTYLINGLTVYNKSILGFENSKGSIGTYTYYNGAYFRIDVEGKPAPPSVSNNNTLNTVSGMDTSMEYNLDNLGWIAYTASTFNSIDFKGNHSLQVRIPGNVALGTVASDPVTLTFTSNTAPSAPLLSADDYNNVVVGTLDETMEYKYDSGNWTTYDSPAFSMLNFKGNHTLQVRYAYNPITDTLESAPIALTFTQNPKQAPPSVSNNDTLNTVTGMDTNMEYNLDNTGWVAYNASNFNSIDFKGDHTLQVRIMADTVRGAAASDTVTLTFTAGTKPSSPNLTVDDINNKVIGTLDETMEYKYDSGNWTTYDSPAFNMLDFRGNHTLQVRFAYNPSIDTPASDPVLLIFTQNSKPKIPTVTVDDTNNKIVGIDETMEYSIDNGDYNLYSSTDNIDLSGDHSVNVRYQANNQTGSPASDPITIIFTKEIQSGGQTDGNSVQIIATFLKPPISYTVEGGTISIDLSKPYGSNVTATPIKIKNNGHNVLETSLCDIYISPNSAYKGFNFVRPDKYTTQQWRSLDLQHSNTEFALELLLRNLEPWKKVYRSTQFSIFDIQASPNSRMRVGELLPESPFAEFDIIPYFGYTQDSDKDFNTDVIFMLANAE